MWRTCILTLAENNFSMQNRSHNILEDYNNVIGWYLTMNLCLRGHSKESDIL